MSGPYTPDPREGGADAFATDDIAATIIEALDAERARIGREIHDGPAQALANAVFLVDDIERQVQA